MLGLLLLVDSLGLLLDSTRYNDLCNVTLAVDDVDSGLVEFWLSFLPSPYQDLCDVSLLVNDVP